MKDDKTSIGKNVKRKRKRKKSMRQVLARIPNLNLARCRNVNAYTKNIKHTHTRTHIKGRTALYKSIHNIQNHLYFTNIQLKIA